MESVNYVENVSFPETHFPSVRLIVIKMRPEKVKTTYSH